MKGMRTIITAFILKLMARKKDFASTGTKSPKSNGASKIQSKVIGKRSFLKVFLAIVILKRHY